MLVGSFINALWVVLVSMTAMGDTVPARTDNTAIAELNSGQIHTKASAASAAACDCEINQGGASFPVSALQGDESVVDFYSHSVPIFNCANTGLEISNTLILFLYEDTTTAEVSMVMIADIPNDGSGGTMEAEINCLPDDSYLAVGDEVDEFSGTPPLMTGDWWWTSCCTDGGAIGNVGCGNSFNFDLFNITGIDAFVWLTGDLANPDQIPLSLDGGSVWINCGGGVCCPVGLDTEIIINDVSCPGEEDGSIDLDPQDGNPAYDFTWAHGETTGSITGLAEGTYEVTITDSEGCTEELVIEIGVMNEPSPGSPATIELCSSVGEEIFDLTSVESTVNMNSGFTVLWFENSDLTGDIADPENYLSGTTTVYAVVDNGLCLSEPVPVDLVILDAPVATPISYSQCEEEFGLTTFDLSELESGISGGVGMVLWYWDAGLADQILDLFISSGPVTIYAVVDDGNCVSEAVEVVLNVDFKPVGYEATIHACGDDNDQAVFDLTSVNSEIGGDVGTVEWYTDSGFLDEISDPAAYLSQSDFVYARIFDGICYSDPITVELIVEDTPVGEPLTAQTCDDGSGEGAFNLLELEDAINAGGLLVVWFEDELLELEISSPQLFVTTGTTVYAVLDNGACQSDPVPVELLVVDALEGNSTSMDNCALSNDMAVFDLASVEGIVGPGADTVLWFEDSGGTVPINDPGMYLSGAATVYAVIVSGQCSSDPVPVMLNIIDAIVANPAQLAGCEDANSEALFDLTDLNDDVSSGVGTVNWYWDSAGAMPINMPDSLVLPDTVVYAQVDAGGCLSDVVPITLMALASPTASNVSIDLCGDENGMVIFDLTSLDTAVIESTGTVSWFADASLTTAINDPTAIMTGDTTVYATVSIGSCVSPAASITLNVSSAITASSTAQEICIMAGDTLLIDLTQMDDVISGGAGQVSWFTDPAGMNSIGSPMAFAAYDSVTLYAHVSNGVCTSPLVAVAIAIEEYPTANDFSIRKCGDANSQAIFDLTIAEPAVSANTGTVSWFLDMSLTTVIADPANYLSATTDVYAVVTSAFCVSQPALVSLEVVDSLIANSISIEECALGPDAASLDLTMYDLLIGGGGGDVYWFNDALATDSLLNPESFVTQGDTLYALVAADGCVSNVAEITIEVAHAFVPDPQCVYSSIDSIAMSWEGLADSYLLSYAVNGQPVGSSWQTQSTTFNLGGLAQGDSVTLTLVYQFNSICDPISAMVTCSTIECPTQVLEFIGLEMAYCRDVPYVVVGAEPVGGTFVGAGMASDTLFPGLVPGPSTTITYIWEDQVTGCHYEIDTDVQIFDALATPAPDCQSTTLSSVSFAWPDQGVMYEYFYTINQGVVIGPEIADNTTLLVEDLDEGDEVSLTLWAVGSAPCGNSDTVTIACTAEECPAATIAITDPGILCSEDSPLQLSVDVNGVSDSAQIVWSGEAIINSVGLLDPSLATSEQSTVMVEVIDGGCTYNSIIELDVNFPLASPSIMCLDEDINSITIEWDPVPGASSYTASSTLGDASVSDYSATISNLPPGTTVGVTITAEGTTVCGPSTAEISCRTLEIPPEIFIPNVFSPNGDGTNDVFYISTNSEVEEVLTLRIFDRWGGLLFENSNFPPNDPALGWDGRSSGTFMQPGVYVYWANLRTVDGLEIVKIGDVTLVR